MPEQPDRRPFTESNAARALAVASCEAGLDASGAQLIRMGENAIYSLPREAVVARIARSASLADRVLREVEVADWLAGHDFPAVRSAPDVKQGIEADGRLVTFWQLVAVTGEEPSVAALGHLLHDLHELPAPPFALPTFYPFSVVPSRLDHPGPAPAADVAFLRSRYEALLADYQALDFASPFGFIHGDAHRGNILMSPAGPLLSDFETVACGPREWYLTPTAMSVERFGLSVQDYAAFTHAYGADVRDSSVYPVLREIREITMTTWLMQLYQVSEQHAAEFRLRMDSLREGDHGRLWHAA